MTPLISADDAKSRLTSGATRFVDATWFMPGTHAQGARRLYEAGHVPHAVFFDIDEICDASSPYPHMLPSPEQFAAKVGALGITERDEIVIYDANRFFASARVWWMFRIMGAARVQVVDGGAAALVAAGVGMTKTPVVPAVRRFMAQFDPELLVTTLNLHARLQDRGWRVLDARPSGRFAGTDPEPRAGLSSGHMPGAESLPASVLLTADGYLRSADELAQIIRPDDRHIATTCGSGVSAAIINLALAVLGRHQCALYDGSWSEWAASGQAIENDQNGRPPPR